MRLVYQIPFKPLFKSRKRIEQRGLDSFYRKQRHQADERERAHTKVSPAWHMQYVVVELIFIIPEPDSFAAEIVHGSGNAEKVLEEFRRDIFIDWVFTRELQRDAQHV